MRRRARTRGHRLRGDDRGRSPSRSQRWNSSEPRCLSAGVPALATAKRTTASGKHWGPGSTAAERRSRWSRCPWTWAPKAPSTVHDAHRRSSGNRRGLRRLLSRRRRGRTASFASGRFQPGACHRGRCCVALACRRPYGARKAVSAPLIVHLHDVVGPGWSDPARRGDWPNDIVQMNGGSLSLPRPGSRSGDAGAKSESPARCPEAPGTAMRRPSVLLVDHPEEDCFSPADRRIRTGGFPGLERPRPSRWPGNPPVRIRRRVLESSAAKVEKWALHRNSA